MAPTQDIPAVAFPFAPFGLAAADGPRASHAARVAREGRGRPRAASSGDEPDFRKPGAPPHFQRETAWTNARLLRRRNHEPQTNPAPGECSVQPVIQYRLGLLKQVSADFGIDLYCPVSSIGDALPRQP